MKNNMQLTFVSDQEETPHFHAETEILYGISGQTRVVVRDRKYTLGAGDIVAINSGIEHELYCRGDAAVCKVQYSRTLIDQTVGFKSGDLNANSVTDTSRSYDRLREIFRQLILDELDQSRRDSCRQNSLLYELLGELLHHFNVSQEEGHGETLEDERVQAIIRYVNQNFQDSVSLNDIADELYTSISTLSRLFKKQTGMHFAEYVKGIRLRYACQELKYSNSNITKIAIDSGFTNLSGFNRVFREEFSMSPTDYRKVMREEMTKQEKRQRELKESLRQNMEEQLKTDDMENDGSGLQIRANINTELPWKKIWNQTINVGSMQSLLRANMQYHVTYLAEQLGYRYVGLWGIFTEPLMITDGVHKNQFNFDQLDSIFDFLTSYHLIPFLDFGPRPSTAVGGKKISEEASIYMKDENIHFRSREVWENAVESLLRHVRERYGEEQVRQWIFEMGYDLTNRNVCYEDENYHYYTAWKFFYRSVKTIIPGGLTAGPGVVLDLNDGWFTDYLRFCTQEETVPDYMTLLLFPYRNGGEKRHSVPETMDHFEKEQMRRLKEFMRAAGVDTKICGTEWNPTVNSRNFINDSCYRGTYFINHVMDMWNDADTANVWVASDWVSSYFDVHGVANGGNGIITRDSICKPAYYALQFLNMLDDRLITYGKNYIVTAGDHGGYHVLLTNHKRLSERYYMRNQTITSPDGLDDIFENEEPLDIDISLVGVEDTRYIVKRRSVGNAEGSLLTEWKNFGYDQNLGGPEITYLRHVCFPRMGMKKINAGDGVLTIQEKLQAHDMVLLHIYPEKN